VLLDDDDAEITGHDETAWRAEEEVQRLAGA
jgi:hypothetical protein